jgi:hypothetical protein
LSLFYICRKLFPALSLLFSLLGLWDLIQFFHMETSIKILIDFHVLFLIVPFIFILTFHSLSFILRHVMLSYEFTYVLPITLICWMYIYRLQIKWGLKKLCSHCLSISCVCINVLSNILTAQFTSFMNYLYGFVYKRFIFYYYFDNYWRNKNVIDWYISDV